MNLYNNLIFIGILTITICSCGKNLQKNVTQESSVVDLLNHGQYQEALIKADQMLSSDPDNQELLYLKAQALSGVAGIDIYSLFPIIKMKLFDVAMTEWNNINKYSRRHNRDIEIISGTEDEELVKYDKKIKELEATPLDKIQFKVLHMYYSDYSYPRSCNYYLWIETNLVEFLYNHGTFSNLQFSIGGDCRELTGLEESFIKSLVKGNAILEIRARRDAFLSRKQTETVLKMSLAVFESLPVIKKTPDIADSSLPLVSEAQIILDTIRLKINMAQRLGTNSRQQLGLLSGHLLIVGLKRTVDVENVKDHTDLICKADPEKFIQNYDLFLSGFKYLNNAIIDTEFAQKNGTNFNNFKKMIDSLPDQLDDEQKKLVIDTIKTSQTDICLGSDYRL